MIGYARRLLLAVCLAAAPQQASADPRPSDFTIPESAVDVTARYQSLLDGDALDPALVEAAFAPVRHLMSGVRVVIVPSYLTDLLMPGRELGLIDYFSDQQLWLESLGAETVLAPVDTEATVETNGRVLVDMVEASDRPVCFISHSKGGIDTLEAMIHMTTAELSGVRCWIALQAPFGGSPIADAAAGWEDARMIIDELLAALGGSGRSLDDLTVPIRQAYMRRADDTIREVTCHVPVLSVATVMPQPEGWLPQSRFEPGRLWMAWHGIWSDGVVPTYASILPHAPYIIVDGLNHTDTVDGDRPFGDRIHNDVVFLKALLAIALRAPVCAV